MRNIIPFFTQDEIKDILKKSNFTQSEKQLFNLRNEEKSLEECSEIMNCSVRTISRLNKRLNDKLQKICTFS